MIRPVLASVIFASIAVGPGEAQTGGGPPIAFVKVAGTAHEIYLVNPDGSSSKKIYATAAKRAIGWLDLKPGGAEIAFTEYGKDSPRLIKLLTLDGSNPVGTPRTLAGPCAPDTVDYHPTDAMLIISDICNQNARIATIRTDGTGYTVLQSSGGFLNKARWLRDGISYVYARAAPGGGPLQLCRNGCDPANNELLRTVSGLWWMDVGRTSNTVLFDDGGSYINKIDADSGALIASNYITGIDGHYSPDDRRVLHETPHSARGDYLQIYDDATGLTTRLSSKGDYGSKDWRN